MAEFIGGLRSSDDVKITGNLVLADPGQAALRADQADGLVHAYTVVFPTGWGATFSFSAVVLDFTVGTFTIKGDAVLFSVTMKVSGAVTLNETLSAGATTPFFVFTPAGLTAPLASATPGTYVNTQASTVESVVVKPYATAATAVITVNGNVVATGVDSTAIALGEDGSLTPVTIIVKETGKVAVTYAIMVLRETTV
jgi:hypothetical protein